MSTKPDSDSYNKRVKALFTREAKLGLEQMKKLSLLYGEPEKKFKSLHIAGTNGKGSVSLKIAKALEKEGYKVGLYTSPHISCFRERIRINGEMISEADLLRLLPDDQEGSFFEMATMLAFRYFAEKQVDWAVIETGLGGRLDATNILIPELSLITSISLDHTDILGTSLEAIAFEKGGILKPGIPGMVGPRANFYKDVSVVPGNFKDYNSENNEIAKAALTKLGISSSAITFGLSFLPPCRFEQVGSFILDVAHNADGMKHLVEKLNGEKKLILLSISKNKSVKECLEILKPYAIKFIVTESSNGRTLKAQDLKKLLLEIGVEPKQVQTVPHPSDAVKIAKLLNMPTLVTGTFFIMREIRAELGFLETADEFDLNESRLPVNPVA